MKQPGKEKSVVVQGSSSQEGQGIVLGLWGVRYQVEDVSRSIAFYTQQLGFKLDQKNLPAFAQVSIGNFKLILSGPGASGSRPMPDGHKQEPGGWNRVILHVADLPARIEALTKARLHFRNQMEVGPGGRQIQLEDPDGNPSTSGRFRFEDPQRDTVSMHSDEEIKGPQPCPCIAAQMCSLIEEPLQSLFVWPIGLNVIDRQPFRKPFRAV